LSDITSLHRALVAAILEGKGHASLEIRRAAFDNHGLAEPVRTFADKVANRARTVTDSDIDLLRKSGLSEDQIYEIVVCASVGQATRQYTNALSALDAATGRS
jgi:alkylhydroperoxidase family enzyme